MEAKGTFGWRGTSHSGCLHISWEQIVSLVCANEMVTNPISPAEDYRAVWLSTTPLALGYTMRSQMSL